ncbi:hypothetical protein FEM03_06050 [Phragmitibacter flavus]|uniref:Uncharacterized protein n=1 Tax=Phragmitibacter flavus TaxID=2576071 RepID=A0A5R8KJ99_9BACT|nr:hypothetical protein [Phragmitibacter flavus]TLD71699.1 hypothetical protein FEM03_06050 [Phragmitibacter flavus]
MLDAVGTWADAAGNWLAVEFPDATDVPPMENMIKLSGLLTIDRKFLESSDYDISDSESCPSIERAILLLEEKGLVVARSTIIKESTCSKCEGSYRDCGCIKMVGAEVRQMIMDFENLGFFWTDRRA